MGIRVSFGKALANGWIAFNHEMQQGLSEHQTNVAIANARRRMQHVDSLITGNYSRTYSSSRVTNS